MTEERAQAAECQLCHQMIPKSDFYKRKDNGVVDGEHNWIRSYCDQCDFKINSISRTKNPEHYREYYKQQGNKYYNNNKDKVKIIQKRYYYKKLSPEKQVLYKKNIVNESSSLDWRKYRYV